MVIKEKVLELLLYFTKHEDEEVKTKAIIGLGEISRPPAPPMPHGLLGSPSDSSSPLLKLDRGHYAKPTCLFEHSTTLCLSERSPALSICCMVARVSGFVLGRYEFQEYIH